MAKKSSTSSWGKIAGFMAFFAIMVAGIDAVVGFLFDGSVGILSTIASIFLIVSVSISGWRYLVSTKLPGNKNIWLIVFFVFAILACIGVIAV